MDKYIDSIEKELIELSKSLYDHPELSFKEVKAVELLTSYLKSKSFKIQSPIAGLDTAFIAEYDTKKPGPNLSYIAEYDALIDIGHGCGHHLIAAMSVGAAVALSQSEDAVGKIYVIGTPAEEGGGGKIMMLEKGVFESIDYAMMIHPATQNLIMRGGLATRSYSIDFHGTSAHSSAPEKGINALSAVIKTFNLIDQERPKLPTATNINGIITEGGKASNVICNEAKCIFSVRCKTKEMLDHVIGRLDHIVAGVNMLEGTQSDVRKGLIYTERYPNQAMAECLQKHMSKYQVEMVYPDPNMKLGSSDIGNVSMVIPTIHSYLNIWDGEGSKPIAHDISFTQAGDKAFAYQQMIKGIKGLSLTGQSILNDEHLREEINTYHARIKQ